MLWRFFFAVDELIAELHETTDSSCLVAEVVEVGFMEAINAHEDSLS